MKIKNIIATLYFEKEIAPRNFIEKLEKVFPNRFNKPFNAQPIPNDAPAMIPRITINSQNGLENIIISQINMQYTINFNEEINDINSLILEYKEVILNIFNGIKETLNKESYYFGILSVIENDSKDPIKDIKEKYLKSLDENTCELNIRYGKKEDDKYYVNYLINNSTEVTGNFALPKGEQEINLEIISTSKFEEVRRFIQKTIDINDKLSFNKNENYRTTQEEICNIIDKLKTKLLEESE